MIDPLPIDKNHPLVQGAMTTLKIKIEAKRKRWVKRNRRQPLQNEENAIVEAAIRSVLNTMPYNSFRIAFADLLGVKVRTEHDVEPEETTDAAE